MPPSVQSRVFISHAHRDGSQLAERLQRDLTAGRSAGDSCNLQNLIPLQVLKSFRTRQESPNFATTTLKGNLYLHSWVPQLMTLPSFACKHHSAHQSWQRNFDCDPMSDATAVVHGAAR